MGCACGNKAKKDQFQVVTQGGSGRSVYAASSKDAAVKISGKYPGSVVKDAAGTVVHPAPGTATPPPTVKGSGPHEVAE